MQGSEFLSLCLREPNLAAHASGALPVWLWSADGRQILFANPAGAAIFGAETSAAIAGRRLEADDPAAVQIAKFAENLPAGGKAIVERLQGFGAPAGQARNCSCSRISIGKDNAILVVATEAAGPEFSLSERARRMFAGIEEAIAVFGADGALLFATRKGMDQLAGRARLSDLGYGIAADKLGEDASTMQVVHLSDFPQTIGSAAPPEPEPEAEPTIDLGAIARAIQAASATLAQTPVAPFADASEPVIPQMKATKPDAIAAEPHGRTPAPVVAREMPERRHPLRFVWEMDADDRFSIASDEFIELIGPDVAHRLGRPWNEIASELSLDPNGEVAHAITSRDTWSGLATSWPVDGGDERLDVELAGLPAYDRDRKFRGYRGFGVCRDLARLNAVLARRAPARPDAVSDDQRQGQQPEKAEARPTLTVVRGAENVVPFRAAGADNRSATLSPVERTAFRELATTLTARLKGADEVARGQVVGDDEETAAGQPVSDRASAMAASAGDARASAQRAPLSDLLKEARPLLDRLPTGILVYRHDQFIYANRAFLDWTGCETLTDFSQAGGLDALFIEPQGEQGGQGQALRIATPDPGKSALEGRLFTLPWEGTNAMALVLRDAGREQSPVAASIGNDARELHAILDIAADGVIMLDAQGQILSSNSAANRLFGYDKDALIGSKLDDLFAPESERIARHYFDLLARGGTDGSDDGRELIGKRARGPLVPLIVSIARVANEPTKFAAVFRDMTQWKKYEEELVTAHRMAEKASSAKSEFLAKISHEMRTPLNAIIGFSEVMMGERFGPIGNDRYRDYLKDIHTSGSHLVALLNDLLDLSKIEAGKMELNFERVDLNNAVQQSVGIMQPQATRARIIVRTSLAPAQPRIVADARSVRQIMLNILSNSIKFTGAGGQVIVSTALSDAGDAVLRMRDTGTGMSEKDIQVALEPFRQLATTTRSGPTGTGLGLPLTKALTEANRARFSIKSAVNAGTLVEIVFPALRGAAE